MLRVNDNVVMAPAYFEGVSGAIVPLPWNDKEDTTVSEVNVEVKKEQEGSATAAAASAPLNGTELLDPLSKNNGGRRATEISSLGGGSAANNNNNKATARRRRSSNTLSSSSSSLEEGGGGHGHDESKEPRQTRRGSTGSMRRATDAEEPPQTRRRSSTSLGNGSMRRATDAVPSPYPTNGGGSSNSLHNMKQVEPYTTGGENGGALRRRSSAFPPRVINERSTTRVSYAGNENEYVMFENEWLTYQDTFSRHCVTEGQGGTSSEPERHVYVDAAVTLFEKSKLDRETIGKIWDIRYAYTTINEVGGKLLLVLVSSTTII